MSSQIEPVPIGRRVGPAGGRKRSLLATYWVHRALVLMFLPGLLYFIVFHYVPIYGVQIAFRDYFFLKGMWRSPWVGWDNFRDAFALGSFWEVFGNTLVISTLKLLFGFPAPIVLALLLNEMRSVRFRRVAQTISYLPHFLSWVVLGGLFKQLLSPSFGPVNAAIAALGLKPVYFLANPATFRGVLVVTSVWKEIGWGSIIYLAALAGVDPQLYEAALIDGASRRHRIRYVTIPSLAPVITIMILLGLRTIVQDDFDQIFNLYNEAVYSVGDVIGTYVYRVGLVELRYGLSTAVGLFRNVAAFALIVGANAVARRISDYGVW